MRHHFIKTLLFTFLLFTPALQAQYLPLLEEGKQWNYYGNSTVTAYIQGDSLVNGLVYKRFVSPGLLYLDSILLLREDTTTQQVYFLSDSIERLLYDFSVELGDTFTVYSPYTKSQRTDTIPIMAVVKIIDTFIDMQNTPRKWLSVEFTVDSLPSIPFGGPIILGRNAWIEGIGGLVGFFTRTSLSSSSPFYSLLCAWKDSVQIYQQNSQNICYRASMSVDLNSSVNNTIKLYPNPANSVVVFTFDSEHMQIKSLTLHDMLGREVLVKEYTSHSRTVELDVSALPSGMYSTRIEDSNGQVYVEKLIVEK